MGNMMVPILLAIAGIQLFMGLNNVLGIVDSVFIAGAVISFGLAMKSEGR